MDRPTQTALIIGEWRVDPVSGRIARAGETVILEARTMRLLLCLAERPGQTIDTDELLDRVWSGTIVTQDSVYQAVASLRKILRDDARNPAYIVTVPRRGYRLIAEVKQDIPTARRARPWSVGVALGLAALLVAIAGLTWSKLGNPEHSIAVLPFLDLTSQSMQEEYFADGMTEELVDRLSKVPGLRVVGGSANSRNSAHVIEGSVRRSGTQLRVTARLVRTEDGFVVWSETYDRESSHLLRVQDDIASEVVKALQGSQLLAR